MASRFPIGPSGGIASSAANPVGGRVEGPERGVVDNHVTDGLRSPPALGARSPSPLTREYEEM
jgi:hypothetical protein